ncbi:MAG: hypothetical protein JRE64_18890 [Deltaproteobacteria bacterium]|nr:hypothetical protein [Deltaproteobacteria bacterium]
MNDILLNILPFGLAIPLFGWLIVSPIVFIWWFLDTDNRDLFTERHKRIATVVFFGAFFSFFFVLGQGIEEFLVFISNDWGGYDEDGKFVSTRSSIAHTLALLLTFFFIYVFDKFEKMRTESRRLEIYKRKDADQRQLFFPSNDN